MTNMKGLDNARGNTGSFSPKPTNEKPSIGSRTPPSQSVNNFSKGFRPAPTNEKGGK